MVGLNSMIFWTSHVLVFFSSFMVMVMVTVDRRRRSKRQVPSTTVRIYEQQHGERRGVKIELIDKMLSLSNYTTASDSRLSSVRATALSV
jgi:hypothetical protein